MDTLERSHFQLIKGKSLYTEIYLKNIVKIMDEVITTRMSVDDIGKYLQKYPQR